MKNIARQFRLFEVNDIYIQYLKQFDVHVMDFSNKGYRTSRKYLGILLSINDCDYFAPLSSPSQNFDYDKNGNLRKSIIPLIRMVNNEKFLGTIKLGCMIPVYDSSLIKYYDLKMEKDIKYRGLVQKQLEFIMINKELIIKNANKLYEQKKANLSMGYISNTVNFTLLEEKAKLYIKQK